MGNNPKLTIDFRGDKTWRLHGHLHREDGPAVEFANGDKYWYLHGRIHREDGPAIEYASSSLAWFLDGHHLMFKEWLKKVNMSPEERTLLTLKYGK